jgi:hypothetical protein
MLDLFVAGVSIAIGKHSLSHFIFIPIFFLVFLNRINPVKVFLHVFPSVKPLHVAAVALSLMIYIFISDVKALVYAGIKTFFHSILSIFFRSVDVVGRYVISCLYGTKCEHSQYYFLSGVADCRNCAFH